MTLFNTLFLALNAADVSLVLLTLGLAAGIRRCHRRAARLAAAVAQDFLGGAQPPRSVVHAVHTHGSPLARLLLQQSVSTWQWLFWTTVLTIPCSFRFITDPPPPGHAPVADLIAWWMNPCVFAVLVLMATYLWTQLAVLAPPPEPGAPRDWRSTARIWLGCLGISPAVAGLSSAAIAAALAFSGLSLADVSMLVLALSIAAAIPGLLEQTTSLANAVAGQSLHPVGSDQDALAYLVAAAQASRSRTAPLLVLQAVMLWRWVFWTAVLTIPCTFGCLAVPLPFDRAAYGLGPASVVEMLAWGLNASMLALLVGIAFYLWVHLARMVWLQSSRQGRLPVPARPRSMGLASTLLRCAGAIVFWPRARHTSSLSY